MINVFSNVLICNSMENKYRAVNYLTKREHAQAQKAFNIFDQDNSGAISIRQFDQILKSLGQNLSQEELEELVQTIDKDGNGFIDFEEFQQLVAPKIISNRSEKAYIEAFRTINESGDGLLTKMQLKRANMIAGAKLSENQLDEIMKYVEIKFGGQFSLETAMKMLLRKENMNGMPTQRENGQRENEAADTMEHRGGQSKGL